MILSCFDVSTRKHRPSRLLSSSRLNCRSGCCHRQLSCISNGMPAVRHAETPGNSLGLAACAIVDGDQFHARQFAPAGNLELRPEPASQYGQSKIRHCLASQFPSVHTSRSRGSRKSLAAARPSVSSSSSGVNADERNLASSVAALSVWSEPNRIRCGPNFRTQ